MVGRELTTDELLEEILKECESHGQVEAEEFLALHARCLAGSFPSAWRDACIQQVDDLRGNPSYWATTREKKIARLEAALKAMLLGMVRRSNPQ